MNRAELIDVVGAEKYELACTWAWRTAAGTGRSPYVEWPDELAMVPIDLNGAIWSDTPLELETRFEVALALYYEMPCYATTRGFDAFFGQFPPETERRFLNAYRSILETPDDRLADPVLYSLWVDFFEDHRTVEQLWTAVTQTKTASSEDRLRRVLSISGPVPWQLKARLFDRLIGDDRWHRAILAALLGSALDGFGQLDADAARDYLGRLALPDPERSVVRAFGGALYGGSGDDRKRTAEVALALRPFSPTVQDIRTSWRA